MRNVTRQLLSLFLCLALSVSLAACGTSAPSATLPPGTPPPTETLPASDVPQTDTPTQPIVDEPPVETQTPTPEVPPSEEPTDPPVETPPVVLEPTYYFGTPLAESDQVEDTHFDTAAFLGDSRTEGLQLFGGIRHGDYYWARGMSVFRADDPNYAVFEIDGEMYTMVGVLHQKQYESIYIMIGVNELGYPAVSYEQGLAKFIDQVLEAQPNAVVYLQILPPVNDDVARANGLANYVNNANINRFNEAIVRIAAEKKVVLLDTAEVYRDENGILPASMASDGCHFNMSGYTPWANYLRTHVMSSEEYHFNRNLDIPEDAPEEPVVEPTDDPAVQPGEEVTETPSPEPTEEVNEP